MTTASSIIIYMIYTAPHIYTPIKLQLIVLLKEIESLSNFIRMKFGVSKKVVIIESEGKKLSESRKFRSLSRKVSRFL